MCNVLTPTGGKGDANLYAVDGGDLPAARVEMLLDVRDEDTETKNRNQQSRYVRRIARTRCTCLRKF